MAFAQSTTAVMNIGSKRASFGSFVTDTTGGDIDTGLVVCEFMYLQYAGATAIADHPAVNETFPHDGSAVTIVVTSGKDGWWFAIGH